MKIMLFNNYRKQNTRLFAEKITDILEKQDVQTIITDGFELQDSAETEVDYIIIVGGDGTFLRATRLYGQKNIPVLGVNMGKVGFLSNIHVDDVENGLNRLLTGQFQLIEKMLLQVSVFRDGKRIHILNALNEVILKTIAGKLSAFALTTEEEEIARLRSDGVIIATPAGSTAYSFSAGGPIVDTDIPAFVVTLLSSYYLHHRPLVISAEKTIRLEIVHGENNVLFADGCQETLLSSHDTIVVQKAPFSLKLIDFKLNKSYWSGIYERLGRNV